MSLSNAVRNGKVQAWRNVKCSTVNTLAMMTVGGLLGLTRPMFLLTTAGTFLLSMTFLWIRNQIRSSCVALYRNKSAAEIAQLSPGMKVEFNEGFDAAQNYLHHTNACSPTSSAFWHPKTFYVDFEAMSFRQDDANVDRERELYDAERLIHKFVPR